MQVALIAASARRASARQIARREIARDGLVPGTYRFSRAAGPEETTPLLPQALLHALATANDAACEIGGGKLAALLELVREEIAHVRETARFHAHARDRPLLRTNEIGYTGV